MSIDIHGKNDKEKAAKTADSPRGYSAPPLRRALPEREILLQLADAFQRVDKALISFFPVSENNLNTFSVAACT